MCDIQRNDSSGTISNFNYPAPYQESQNCIWNVSIWPDHSLRVNLEFFDIFASEECRTDYLKLEHGRFPNQKRMCGHNHGITYILNKTSTYFRFRVRSENNQYTGFRVSYTQVPFDQLTTDDIYFVDVRGTKVPYRSRDGWLS